MKVIIESGEVKTREGVSEKSGKPKPYCIREQSARFLGDRVRGPCKVNLRDGQAPYAPGEYVIDFEQSMYIGQFGRLGFSVVLVPAKAEAPRLASAS